ncbi:MAG: ABC transporter permease [archaeon]
MRLFAIIKKEIMEVKNQRIALLLILLYPFLGALLMGLASSGVGVGSSNQITIGLLKTNNPLIGEISKDSLNYKIVEFSLLTELKEAVKRKQVQVGLEVQDQGVENGLVQVLVYYDNSSGLASSIYGEFLQSSIKKVAHEKVLQTIAEMLSAMGDFSGKMDTELLKVNDFVDQLNLTETNLNILEDKINSFDVASIESDLVIQKQNVESFKQKNALLKQQLVVVRSNFENAKSQVTGLSTTASSYSSQISLLANQIDQQKVSLSNTIIQLNYIYAYNLSDYNSRAALAAQISALTVLRDNLDSIKSNLYLVGTNLSQINNSQSSLTKTINSIDSVITDAETQVNDIDYKLISASTTLNKVDVQIQNFKVLVVEAKDVISKSRISKNEIQEKLMESKEIYVNLMKQINNFDSLKPELIAEPIKVNMVPVHENEKLIFHLIEIDPTQLGVTVSNTLSIILILACVLLTSIVMLSEKSQNVTMRFNLSHTNKIELTIGKVLGQAIIGFICISIIFITSIVVFGFSIFINYLQVLFALALILFAFISIGLIIGKITKSQSTAILLSLLVIIPMLFISGIIVPLELMPSSLAFIASFAPLTAANNLLLGILVRFSDLQFMINDILVLLVTIIIGLILAIIKKD